MTAQDSETIVSENETPKLIAFPYRSSDGALDYVSPSSIKLYLQCSLKYYFKKILGIPEPASTNLHLGKAVHAGIQAFHLARWRDEDASADAIVAKYREAFTALAQEDGIEFEEGEEGKSRDKGEVLLRAYFESNHAKLDEKPLGVEVQLQEDFPELPSPLMGYIDLVWAGNIPVDFKTIATTPNVETEAFQHELQLTCYQLLIESATGEKVTARELVFLVKTKTPKIVVHRIPPADATAVARFWSMAQAMVDGVYHERWAPQPGMHCSWCSYRQQCSLWKGGLE